MMSGRSVLVAIATTDSERGGRLNHASPVDLLKTSNSSGGYAAVMFGSAEAGRGLTKE